jgi:hypothetical protein
VWHTADGKAEYQFRAPKTGGRIVTQGKVFPFVSYEVMAPTDMRVRDLIAEQKLSIQIKDLEGVVATTDEEGDNLTVAFLHEDGCLFDPFSVGAKSDDCLAKIGTLEPDFVEGAGWGFRTGTGQNSISFHYRFVSPDEGGVFSLFVNGDQQNFPFSGYYVIAPAPGFVENLLSGEKGELFSFMLQTGKNCLVEPTNVGPDCLVPDDE